MVYAFQRHGYSVWWDDYLLPSSDLPFKQIDKQISLAKCVVVLWSKDSVKSKSVMAEAIESHKREILIPVIIDKYVTGDDIPLEFRHLTTANLAKWSRDIAHPEFEKLLKSISELTKISPVYEPQINLKKLWRVSLKLALMLVILTLLVYWGAKQVPQGRNKSIGWDVKSDGAGLKIVDVIPGGLADKKLQAGDDLISINGGANLLSTDDAYKAREKLRSDEVYTVRIQRDKCLQEMILNYPRTTTVKFEGYTFGLDLIHVGLVFLLVFIIFTPSGLPRRDKLLGSEFAGGSFGQFIKGWIALWITWLVLYLFMSVILYLVYSKSIEVCGPCYNTAIDFLNIANSIVFFYLFFVLDMPSVPGEMDRNRDNQFRHALHSVIIIGLLVFFLAALGRFNSFGLNLLAPILSGSLVAISMTFVIGRLDSHYMNVSRWMLAFLYLYAIIQVVGPILIGLQLYEYERAFFFLVLLLKIYLFVVITNWLKDGSFENYFNKGSAEVEASREREASRNNLSSL